MIKTQGMRIGIVHTSGSPCRCAESVVEGLRALGHEFLIVDSEEIEDWVLALADCDLVIDHTDTFRGRGLYRSLVRHLLESSGARVIGPSAAAFCRADNKAAVKARLAEAGIPVPPGIAAQSENWELPAWLRPPLVVKPAFEHMSRGVHLAETEVEARGITRRLLESMHGPVLIESFIGGVEIAASILATPKGLQVLPLLEWKFSDNETRVLTEDFKLSEDPGVAPRWAQAFLPQERVHQIEAFALQAFRTLELRDYGRFDLRLSPNGTPYFLEANTTPSLEPLEALAISARLAGLDYPALVDCLLEAGADRLRSSRPTTRVLRIERNEGNLDLTLTEGTGPLAPSSLELVRFLDIQAGERVLDLGCGSGLLSIAAARLGASRVTATDLDVQALQWAERNAMRNGVEGRIEFYAGSWYEALRGEGSRPADGYDVIVATPPQTPGCVPFGPKYGGPEGLNHMTTIIREAAGFLNPNSGRLWLVAISLANLRKLWEILKQCFEEVTLVHETDRIFTAEEYESLQEGLFEYLCRLRSAGKAQFANVENGRYSFRNCFIRAMHPRLP